MKNIEMKGGNWKFENDKEPEERQTELSITHCPPGKNKYKKKKRGEERETCVCVLVCVCIDLQQ